VTTAASETGVARLRSVVLTSLASVVLAGARNSSRSSTSPEASSAQNNMAAVAAVELLVYSFDHVGGGAAPLAWRQTREGEQPVGGFLHPVGDGFVLEPPRKKAQDCHCLSGSKRILTWSA
jgi:hypothetical protein